MTTHNSLVPQATAYYRALFSDIAWLYGNSRKELERDLDHLLRHLGRHGMRVACIDLPSCCKHFDQCLDQGFIQPFNLTLTRARSKVDKVPKFLGYLFQRIFDTTGMLRLDASVDCIAAIRQVYSGLKKLELPCKQEAINVEVQEFLDVESTLRPPSLDWASGWARDDDARHLAFYQESRTPRDGMGRFVKRPDGLLIKRLDVLHKVCDIVCSMLGDFSLEEFHELPKHGPGATALGPKSEWKFSFTNWPERLDSYFPYARYAVPNEGLVFDTHSTLTRIEYDSRLICVPKTLKGPRLIAAEPVENQWIQQLVWNQLEHRIGSTPISSSICFRSQERNQRLAVEGSLTGKVATIDLSSASDRLSLWTIERCFRNNSSLLRRLWSCRTGGVSLSAFDGFPSRITTRKFATMGSACTFPVQTVVYAMMAISCVIQGRVTIRSIREAASKVQVFGDDIVIPTEKLPLLKQMLGYFQLKVNHAKTFSGYSFRESCGVDAFRGHEVQPIYIKLLPQEQATLGDLASLVDTHNNYYESGYWRIAEVMRGWCSKFGSLIQTKAPCSAYFGFSAHTWKYVPLGKTRWNKRLHRVETKQVRQKCQTSLAKVYDVSALSMFHFGAARVHAKLLLRSQQRAVGLGLTNPTPLLQRAEVLRSLRSVPNQSPTVVKEQGGPQRDTLPSDLRVGWIPLAEMFSSDCLSTIHYANARLSQKNTL